MWVVIICSPDGIDINADMRWRNGRHGFVLDLSRGVFDPARYEVVHTRTHADASRFVRRHHYSGTTKGGGQVFELHRGGALVGVAVYSQPGGPAVLRAWFPGHEKSALELSRLVLLDDVPFNGETWFLSRTRELLWREGYTSLVSFSDPMPRERLDGTIVLPGHVGVCYAASSAIYTGQTGSDFVYLFGDGTIMPARAIAKVRAYAAGAPDHVAKGWRYATDALVAHGAPLFMFAAGDPRAETWIADALRTLTRKVLHPGQHRYFWTRKGGARKDLERHLAKKNVPVLPYPKVTAEIVAARAAAAAQRQPVAA